MDIVESHYKVKYFVQPSSGNKLHVIQPPKKIHCRKCEYNHKCILFPLEQDMYIYYCPYHDGGNWIFCENPRNL